MLHLQVLDLGTQRVIHGPVLHEPAQLRELSLDALEVLHAQPRAQVVLATH
jgi:hypothetical protein